MKEFDFVHYLKALHYAVESYSLSYDGIGLLEFLQSFCKEDIDPNVLKTLLLAIREPRKSLEFDVVYNSLKVSYILSCKRLSIRPV